MSMTVKHCLPGGEEFLYPVPEDASLNFVPARAKHEGAGSPDTDSLYIDLPAHKDRHHSRFELTTGRAYVMNDHGSTVATYWLSGSRSIGEVKEAA